MWRLLLLPQGSEVTAGGQHKQTWEKFAWVYYKGNKTSSCLPLPWFQNVSEVRGGKTFGICQIVLSVGNLIQKYWTFQISWWDCSNGECLVCAQFLVWSLFPSPASPNPNLFLMEEGIIIPNWILRKWSIIAVPSSHPKALESLCL